MLPSLLILVLSLTMVLDEVDGGARVARPLVDPPPAPAPPPAAAVVAEVAAVDPALSVVDERGNDEEAVPVAGKVVDRLIVFDVGTPGTMLLAATTRGDR